MLFRPPEYLEDVRERELEIRAIEERLGARDLHCPVCRAEVEPTTSSSARSARPGSARRARRCGSPLEPLWQICPYCETPVSRRRARPRRAASERCRRPERAARRVSVAYQSARAAWLSSAPSSSPSRTPSGAGLAGEILGALRAPRARRCARRGSSSRSRELGETHYAEHREKPFFGELVDFITSAPTLALVLEGEGAIATVPQDDRRDEPADADPGTLRGDFALAMPDNLVHGSDSPESAEREIGIWFPDGLV